MADNENPATLLAIAYACHRIKEQRGKESALRQLEERFGIKVTFKRRSPAQGATR